MPLVDESRQKGNFAESIAAAWLSRRCLVRPVSSGTDIGVELYCESLVGTSPFQHFWVQIKAISERNIGGLESEEKAWYDFETRHLRYWQRQPVPVYAFLVPVIGWPSPFPSRIYGVNISDELLRNGIPTKKTVRYHTTNWFDADEIDEDLDQFLSRIVPIDTAALLVPKGIVLSIEWPDEREEVHLPKGLTLKHIDVIEDAIRQTAEICLAELVEDGSVAVANTGSRERLETILSQYEDNLTALGASAVANSAIRDGNFQKVRRFLDIAESFTLASHIDEATRQLRLERIHHMKDTLPKQRRQEPPSFSWISAVGPDGPPNLPLTS